MESVRVTFFLFVIVVLLGWLFVSIQGYKKQSDFMDFSLRKIEIGSSSKIQIQIPSCNISAIDKMFVTVHGAWRLSDGVVRYDCVVPKEENGFFAIKEINVKSEAEVLAGRKNLRLIKSIDGYKVYRYGWRSVDSFEAFVFQGFDGRLVYLDYSLHAPERITVHRKISSRFEALYHIELRSNSLVELYEADRVVFGYFKKIIVGLE